MLPAMRAVCEDERIYAPDESNIIPQSNAGSGGTRSDLLVLRCHGIRCAALLAIFVHMSNIAAGIIVWRFSDGLNCAAYAN
jgi:hypothetical protein